jgi:hypothetical protein
MAEEFIVFIHGITPKAECTSHSSEYDELYNGISRYMADNKEWKEAHAIPTEWGWNFDDTPEPDSHRVLCRAQELLTDRVLNKVSKTSDFTLNPLRLVLNPMRQIMLYGFSDMFYYVSTEGKNAVRRSISEQIAEKIAPYLKGDDTQVSLTLVGHSAGSVIAIDLSYYLFSGKKYSFIQDEFLRGETSARTKNILETLKHLAEKKNIRLRRLITLGSPISLLACRKDAVVDLLANGEKINPELHGIVENNNFEKLEGPRWLNIWDKDDPIALPIEPLMDNSKNKVIDIRTRISNSIMKVHNMYWESSVVHKIIAGRW